MKKKEKKNDITFPGTLRLFLFIYFFSGPELSCGLVSNVKRRSSFFHLQPVARGQGETADFQAWLLTVSGSKNLF